MGKFIASHVVINNVKAVGTYYKKETPFSSPRNGDNRLLQYVDRCLKTKHKRHCFTSSSH